MCVCDQHHGTRGEPRNQHQMLLQLDESSHYSLFDKSIHSGNDFSFAKISLTLLHTLMYLQWQPLVGKTIQEGHQMRSRDTVHQPLPAHVNEGSYCEQRLNCSGTEGRHGTRTEAPGITTTTLKGSASAP